MPVDARELPASRGLRQRTHRCPVLGHVVSEKQQTALNNFPHARHEFGRSAVVNRHDDGADEQATPKGDDPLGPVFAPDEDFVACRNPEITEASGKRPSRACHIFIGIRAVAVSVVVAQEGAARDGQVIKKVQQVAASHDWIMM